MKNIYTKLADIQENIGAMTKDLQNPFFKSKYFDINQLIKQLQPFLTANKLLLIQPTKENKVYSIIINVENPTEQIESYLELPPLTDPQKMLACITYFRRGTLQTLLALEAEDDDGNKAAAPVKKEAPKQAQAVKPIALTDAQIESCIAKGTQSAVLDGIVEGKYTVTDVQLITLQTETKK